MKAARWAANDPLLVSTCLLLALSFRHFAILYTVTQFQHRFLHNIQSDDTLYTTSMLVAYPLETLRSLLMQLGKEFRQRSSENILLLLLFFNIRLAITVVVELIIHKISGPLQSNQMLSWDLSVFFVHYWSRSIRVRVPLCSPAFRQPEIHSPDRWALSGQNPGSWTLALCAPFPHPLSPALYTITKGWAIPYHLPSPIKIFE